MKNLLLIVSLTLISSSCFAIPYTCDSIYEAEAENQLTLGFYDVVKDVLNKLASSNTDEGTHHQLNGAKSDLAKESSEADKQHGDLTAVLKKNCIKSQATVTVLDESSTCGDAYLKLMTYFRENWKKWAKEYGDEYNGIKISSSSGDTDAGLSEMNSLYTRHTSLNKAYIESCIDASKVLELDYDL